MSNPKFASAPPAWAFTSVLAIFATSAMAASFPCEKASSRTEKAICGSNEISNLDEYLGRYYSAARARFKHAESCLAADQRGWLREVRDGCKDADCLKRAYLDRLSVLHAVQPGVTSLRHLSLPKVPQLVWIIPPAQDQVAAPRGGATVAHLARGKVVNQVSGGDGYVLQSSDGKNHLLVPLMFLEQPTVDALDVLAREPDAGHEVRGRASANQAPPIAFSSGHCTFVYRTVP